MSVYKPAKSPFYVYDFRRGRERYCGSTGKTDRREAEAEERRLIQQAEAQSGPDGRKGLRRSQSDVPTLADAADRYWAEVSQHGASPDADLAALARLASLVGPGTPLTDITDAVVSEAVAARRKQHRRDNPKLGLVSASTVNRSATELLRRVLTRARKVWRIALPHEPNWGAHRLSEPKERVRELRYDEEEKLETVEREDYRAPRLFAQMTGLRRREVAGLTWSQVDFANGTISVVGKGDKPHVLPITDELEALLRPLAGHHPTSVFTFVCARTRVCARSKKPLAKGTRYPITAAGLATQMRRAIDKAGITGLRPMHDFRHTAATRTLRATGNLRLVQQLLNHASPATTAKYAHASLDDMREGMAKAASDSSRRRATLGGMGVQLVTEAATPMQAAITEHRRILDAIKASPPFDGDCEEMVTLDVAELHALEAVLAAPCSNRADALAVLKHFRPYVAAQGNAFGGALRDMGDVTCTVAEAILRALAVALGEDEAEEGLPDAVPARAAGSAPMHA